MNLIDTIKNAHHQGAHRTFGAAHMVKQPMKRIDPSTLEVCDDPIPGHRASAGNKYETVLKSLKYGQCVKCAPSAVGGVAGALVQETCESARVALAEVADRYTRVKRWGVDAKSLQDIPPIVDLYEELLRNATGGQMEQWLGGVREAKGRMAGAAL